MSVFLYCLQKNPGKDQKGEKMKINRLLYFKIYFDPSLLNIEIFKSEVPPDSRPILICVIRFSLVEYIAFWFFTISQDQMSRVLLNFSFLISDCTFQMSLNLRFFQARDLFDSTLFFQFFDQNVQWLITIVPSLTSELWTICL